MTPCFSPTLAGTGGVLARRVARTNVDDFSDRLRVYVWCVGELLPQIGKKKKEENAK